MSSQFKSTTEIWQETIGHNNGFGVGLLNPSVEKFFSALNNEIEAEDAYNKIREQEVHKLVEQFLEKPIARAEIWIAGKGLTIQEKDLFFRLANTPFYQRKI